MDLLELIKTRRSIRRFKKKKTVKQDKIDRILEAARWAPSGLNGVALGHPAKEKQSSERKRLDELIYSK